MTGAFPPMPAIESAPTAARSAIMRSIKSTKTGPEEALAGALRALGIQWSSRNDRSLPGSPDFVFRDKRVAVFVDGDFWHGKGKLPKTNGLWWKEKLRRNVARDRRANRALRIAGWLPYRIGAEFVKRRPGVSALLVWRELELR